MASRGRPFQPGNTFGRGRPPGSRNKASFAAQQLLESHSDAVMRKCLFMALQGDSTAMRLCMERLLPVRREMPVQFRGMKTSTAAEVSRTLESLLRNVACGELTPSEGQTIAEIVENRRRAIDTEEHERRLKALEQQHGRS